MSKRFLPPLFLMFFLALAIEILVRWNWIPSYLVPSPTMIADVFYQDGDILWEAFFSTTFSSLVGFLIAFLIGNLLGAFFSLSPLLKFTFFPYVSFFQTVPIIAIAPMLVIWFGYGLRTVLISSVIVSVFPVIAASMKGLQSTEPAFIDLFRLYKASRWSILFKLRLPFAIPQIAVGAQIASGLSVIGAIVGEFIAGGGLGGLIDTARAQQRVDLIGAAVLLASLIGLFLLEAVNHLSQYFLKSWHPSERNLDS